jgi:4-hydroxyphenylpyruvate dioxygenase
MPPKSRQGLVAHFDDDGSLPAPPALEGWDAIEIWVGNARSSAGFFMGSLGFVCVAYSGPETGVRDRVRYVLEQGEIRLVVTGALDPESVIAVHHQAHGDGVKDLAWTVSDVDAAYGAAVARGAEPVHEPWTESDELGAIRKASIATYGEVTHTFVDRSQYSGAFGPGYRATDLPETASEPVVGLTGIDHIVGNVEQGMLDQWVSFYERVFGFRQLVTFDESQISTQYSALRSTVVTDGERIFMPINEPAPGLKQSQIAEYLDAYGCPGVQHMAMRTNGIVATVAALRARGLRFMEVPDSYYEAAKTRMADVDLAWEALQRERVLVDRDDRGYLMQIFSEVITDRPALFCEVIERHGAEGFGEGNFKALFESFEKSQAERGNL